MRLNHQDIILDFEGNPVPFTNEPGSAPSTFRDLAMVALTYNSPDLAAEKKSRMFGMSHKFYQGKFARLTVEEGSLLKEMAGHTLTPLAYGRLCEWVEGRPQFVGTDNGDPDEDEGDTEGDVKGDVEGVDKES